MILIGQSRESLVFLYSEVLGSKGQYLFRKKEQRRFGNSHKEPCPKECKLSFYLIANANKAAHKSQPPRASMAHLAPKATFAKAKCISLADYTLPLPILLPMATSLECQLQVCARPGWCQCVYLYY